jgi:hypothetical protein
MIQYGCWKGHGPAGGCKLPGTRPTERMPTVDTRSLAHPALRPEKPRTAVCDGCRKRFPRGELIELDEDNHNNLTYFHGDRLCGVCADAAGIIR